MRLLLGVMVVLPGVIAADCVCDCDRFVVLGGLAKAPAVIAAAVAASDGMLWWWLG